MILAENVSFSYGKGKLLKGLNFTADGGECVVLTGPNGSGKSTALALVSGALKPDGGRIVTEGRVSLVPQGTALFEDMTVEENLLFFAGLAGVTVPEQLPFALDPYRKKRLSRLSGGTKKRVSIACALLGDPANLLFDEPCAGLDILYRRELTQLILRLKAESRTILYVSHDPREYAAFADRLLFLGGEEPFMLEAGALRSSADDLPALTERMQEVYQHFCEEINQKEKNDE